MIRKKTKKDFFGSTCDWGLIKCSCLATNLCPVEYKDEKKMVKCPHFTVLCSAINWEFWSTATVKYIVLRIERSIDDFENAVGSNNYASTQIQS